MSAERWRLFVALELPAEVRVALASWGASVAAGVPATGGDLRVLTPESLHVTLCFLGLIPADATEPATASLAAVQTCPAPSLSVGEPLWLPPRRPGVLAVRLDDGDRALERVQRIASQALTGFGVYEPEKRAFLPHVTIARVRRLSKRFDTPPAPSLSFFGERVVLYRSHLGSGGARYEPLATVALGAG